MCTPSACMSATKKRLPSGDARAGPAHVLRGRVDATLGHIGEHRRHHRIAQALGNAAGQHPHPHVVLAQHQVRAVLLGATDGDQQGGGAGGDAVAQLGRGQLLEVHRGVGLRGCAGGNEGHSQEPAPRRFNVGCCQSTAQRRPCSAGRPRCWRGRREQRLTRQQPIAAFRLLLTPPLASSRHV